MEIVLADVNRDVTRAWLSYFGDVESATIHRGSILEVPCDAVVSPTNSFGFLDGTLDRQLAEFFGSALQARLQAAIRARHHGELMVGQAEIVATEHAGIPYVIAAPTMRIPMMLRDTVHVYLATRAALLLVQHGCFADGTPIRERVRAIALPGIGTGTGGVQPAICARQMRAAVDEVLLCPPVFPASWAEAQARHRALYADRPRLDS